MTARVSTTPAEQSEADVGDRAGHSDLRKEDGSDGQGATADEEDTRDSTPALGAGPERARDVAERGREHRRGEQDRGACSAAGLDWDAVEKVEADDELEMQLYGPVVPLSQSRPEPDPAQMHIELRKPGVTLELLHLEYLQEHPTGLKYTAFCERYRRWRKRVRVWMRQDHKAGEKLFVDFSGKRPQIVDPKTGEVRPVELFVAVLGASSYTYAEATLSQKLPDWLRVSANAFEFLGGVPEVTVPDQRRETHFSLESLNVRILELLDELNGRPRRELGGVTRAELFKRIDQPALRPLPTERYVYAEWRSARVNLDYHIQIFDHFYSVPFALAREVVDVRVTGATVEVFHRGRRVACHNRGWARFGHTRFESMAPSTTKPGRTPTQASSSAGRPRSAPAPKP